MKLTQATVNSLSLPASKNDAIHFDDDVPGLGLRLLASGRRSWIFQYQIGQKQRRMSLGSAAAITLGQARRTAGELYARVRLGEDVAASRLDQQRRAADTVEAILRTFLPLKKSALRPSSYIALERHLLRYAKPLHPLGVALVRRRDVAMVLTPLAAASGRATANRTRASLQGFFAWAITQGLIDANPVIGTNIAPEAPRSRVLSLADLAAIWRALPDDAYGRIVRLLILTGQRREEIGGLRRDEFRDDAIVLPASRTKNKRDHIIPLSGPAQAILAAGQDTEPFVFGAAPFTSWSLGKRRLDVDVKLPPWRLHDIRRSVATGMAELGIQPHIIEAVLNHASGHKAGVAGIYNRATYEKEKHTALAMWAEHVMAAVAGRDSNVIPMRG